MLIDGGGSIGPVHSEFDFGEDVVAPYLWSRGIERLDVVALTHADGDHIGGLPRIIEDFHPAELWVGINPDIPVLQRLYETAAANHVAIHRHKSGDDLASQDAAHDARRRAWGGCEILLHDGCSTRPASWIIAVSNTMRG